MKLKHLFYIAILGASISACSNDATTSNEAEKATVKINLSQSALGATVDTRATDQMALENCNLMYNLVLLHYNSNQVLTEVEYDSDSSLSQGMYETTWAPTLTTGDDDYVVLLANVKQDNDGLETQQKWEDMGASRFANLRDVMTTALPLTDGSDGSYDSTKKMFMMGYYHGAITSNMNLNVMMGRMASCIKLVITPTSGSVTVTNVKIENAVMNTYFFPATSSTGLSFGTYTDALSSNNVAKASSPLTLYYYTGENINPEESHRTSATITTNKGTFSVVLGSDSPAVTTNRNYSLYRNNTYTFTLNIKN